MRTEDFERSLLSSISGRGPKYRVCDGVSRRSFLKAGFLALGGLTLADHLRLKAESLPDGRGSDTAVILFWMAGGPSHIDTFDTKPDAPAEIRGPFATIPTNVSGISVCDQLPLHTGIADKHFAAGRTMNRVGWTILHAMRMLAMAA